MSLDPVFTLFRSLYAAIEAIGWSKQQLKALAFSINQLLQTLNRALPKDKYGIPRSVKLEIKNLEGYGTVTRTSGVAAISDRPISIIKEIDTFIQIESQSSFIKLLFTNGDRVVKIEAYHYRLAACVSAFQVRGDAVWNRFI
jgi:hypothetical protein